MFSHGLLMSVRMSLLDGPSLLLLACAVALSERGRRWLSATVLGIAGLGRETNLLGAVALPWPRGWKDLLKTALAGALIVLPLIVWQDYIWSIYRGTSASAGADQLTIPFAAYAHKWSVTLAQLRSHGIASPATFTLLALIAISVQTLFLAGSAHGANLVAYRGRLRGPHSSGALGGVGGASGRGDPDRAAAEAGIQRAARASLTERVLGVVRHRQPRPGRRASHYCPYPVFRSSPEGLPRPRALDHAHWKLKPPMRPSTSSISPIRNRPGTPATPSSRDRSLRGRLHRPSPQRSCGRGCR